MVGTHNKEKGELSAGVAAIRSDDIKDKFQGTDVEHGLSDTM